MKVFVILYSNFCTNNYCYYNFNLCGYCEKFSPRLETRKTNGTDKFLEIKVQQTTSSNVHNRLKFTKISKTNLRMKI